MRKALLILSLLILLLCLGTVVGGSFYMLHYSLAPEANRMDTTASFRAQFLRYPETRPWVDSLRQEGALRDTFVTMPSGERHHALYVWHNSHHTALVLHGWRGSSIGVLFLARIYERELGYNVVIPDFHAHGLSEGDAIGMGWPDRKDMLHWLSVFSSDSVVVHGISMGGATAMMMSAEPMPRPIKDVRFIDDCGYTSVWDEFRGELRNQFGLPPFPLMYTASFLCQLRYGWNFRESSALSQVSRCPHPMLFIHGDADTFVPTEMVHRLYAAKPAPKSLWLTPSTPHADSYHNYPEEYISRVVQFCRE